MHPDVKVLFASGYPAERYQDIIDLDALRPLLAKPYTMHELAVSLRDALDAESVPEPQQ